MPPLKRFKSLDPEQQGKILCTASQMFAENGFDATSLNDIIKKLEISKGQMYYWFEDKADLFMTCIGETLSDFTTVITSHGLPSSKEDYWEHLRTIDEAVIEWVEKSHAFLPLWARILEIPMDHPITARIFTLMMPLQKHEQKTIKLGVEFGVVREDIPLDMLCRLVFNIRSGFDWFELENWDNLQPDERLACMRTRTRVTRAILEKVES